MNGYLPLFSKSVFGSGQSLTNTTIFHSFLSMLAHLELPNMSLLRHTSYQVNKMWSLSSETCCILMAVSSAVGLLILCKLILFIVFGELHAIEWQHLKDKFGSFIFHKFIFVFGVLNVQDVEEVVLWVTWFTGLLLLHLFVQLCKDRFEYMSISPTTPRRLHVKLLLLVAAIMAACVTMSSQCVSVSIFFGPNICAFLIAECLLLGLKTTYVVVRYTIYLWDVRLHRTWECRGAVYAYYSLLLFELTSLAVDFLHHLHMLVWGRVFLSMAGLVIFMHLHNVLSEIKRHVRRHNNYSRVVRDMDARFPMATKEELERNSDDCAICWEGLTSARTLPCGHMFHNSCLRSWLEQDISCPMCRKSLQCPPGASVPSGDRVPDSTRLTNDPVQVGGHRPPSVTNHSFHFDGSRYFSWLPSFSFAVTHTSIVPGSHRPPSISYLSSMVHEVQEMFPHVDHQLIVDDLRQTLSLEQTIENILEHQGSDTPAPPDHEGDRLLDPGRNGLHAGSTDHPQHTMTGSEVKGVTLLQAHGGGGRFSKCGSERMAMLQRRVDTMLRQARRQFTTVHGEQSEEVAVDGDGGNLHRVQQ